MAASPVLFVYYPPLNDDSWPGVPGRHITEADWASFTIAQRRTIENATTQEGYTRRKVWVHIDLVDETEEERAQREAAEAAARAEYDRKNSLVRYGQIETMIDQLEVLPPAEEFAALRQDVNAVADVPPRVEAVETKVARVDPGADGVDSALLRWRKGAPAYIRGKSAYLNDRDNIDAAGASAMGGTISTYLTEFRQQGVAEIISDTGSTYRVGATPITVPGGLTWEGGGRLDLNGGDPATIVAEAGATDLIRTTSSYTTLRGLKLDGANLTNIVLIRPSAHYLNLSHVHLTRVGTGGAAVRGGGLLYFGMDYSMFNLSAGRGLDLRLAHYTGNPGPYYGVNTGQVTRSFFYGSSEGFVRFDGILTLRDNDFEGPYPGTTGMIEVGGGAVNGRVQLESNYFEVSGTNAATSCVYLNGSSALAAIENNIFYGPTGNPAGMAAVRFGGALSEISITNNEFNRWDTAIANIFIANGGTMDISGNGYLSTTTRHTLNSNQRSRTIAGTDVGGGILADPKGGFVYYGGAVQGSCVYYSDPAAHSVVDLARGNVHEFQYTGPVSPSVTNGKAGQIFIVKFGTASATLANSTWRPVEGASTTPAAGTSRLFYVDYTGLVRELGK